MIRISEIIDDVLGQEFRIECPKISLRAHDNEYWFSGPGILSGEDNGPLAVNLHDSIAKTPAQYIDLLNACRKGLKMCLDATDYHGREWIGGWLNPIIQGSGTSHSFVSGSFSQLSTDTALTAFDEFRNATALYYGSNLQLPMLEMADIQRMRGAEIEQRSSHWDKTQLKLGDATVILQEDEEENRTVVSVEHSEAWTPPYCETGLADAVSFVCANLIRPRITIRYFDKKCILFIRQTPTPRRSKLPRPIAYHGPQDNDFWNLFLAFLTDCKGKNKFEGTPLAHLFRELTFAGTGTLHALALSLVVAVDDLVTQIAGPPRPVEGIDGLKEHISKWNGDDDLIKSAIALVSSALSRTSTRKHLRDLAASGVVTTKQIQLWDELRPKLAHGKIANYDEDISSKCYQLVNMVYRLAARILGYKGPLTDYTDSPPTEFDFQWAS